jgi:mono/diheme cytochrome c family protein
MTAKTLGVILITALAIFTAAYWITDQDRRDTRYEQLQADLVEYGMTVFGPPTPEHPAVANCAQCHGPTGEGGQVGNTGRMAPNLHSRSLYEKLKSNPNYVHLVISYGGVVVSGNVNSPMPAWSAEVGGPLTIQQIDALTALVTSWADEAGQQPVVEIPNTVEAGAEVYTSAGCAGCHGPNLEGIVGPSLQNIGNEPVTTFDVGPNCSACTPLSQLDQLVADYQADPRAMLEQWIRDSSTNYNDGTPTNMPAHPESQLPNDALQALITFLLDQTQ